MLNRMNTIFLAVGTIMVVGALPHPRLSTTTLPSR